MTRFNIGEIVCLTTGSDPMTVISVFGTRLVECKWIGKEGKVYKNHFRPDSLVIYEGERPIKEDQNESLFYKNHHLN